jgi:hypothetical protein
LNRIKAKKQRYRTKAFYTFVKCAAFALFLFLLSLYHSFAQQRPATEQQVKAAFIYNFTRFVDWPPEAFESANAPFVIGVLGNDPVASYLEDLVKDEKLDTHNIIVQRFTDLKQIDQCNILFISAEEAAKNNKLIPSINRKGILTVSDVTDFSKWGGVVRFFKEANRLRLQINPAEAKAAQLTISSKLLSISSIYRGR